MYSKPRQPALSQTHLIRDKMSSRWDLHIFFLACLTRPQWSMTFNIRQDSSSHLPYLQCMCNVSLSFRLSLLSSSLSRSLSLPPPAGHEGCGRPVSSPCPSQLPPCPPLSDAPVLAGRSRGQASLRLPPVLLGSAH